MTYRFAAALVFGLALSGCTAETLDAGSTVSAVKRKHPPITRATLGAMVDAFTMDASTLYFTCEDGWVYRLSKSGTSPPEHIARAGAMGSLYTESIAVDETDVYWTALGDGLEGGVVFRAPKSGGTALPIATAQARPWGIAVDDTYVYWADQGGATPPSDTSGSGGIHKGSIQRLVKASGASTLLAGGLNAPDFIALDGEGGVVWHEGFAIRRVDGSGASPTTLLTRSVSFRSTNLLFVEGRALWADDPGDDASVWSASLAGSVSALASNVDPPAFLADSGSSIFWNVATGSEVGAVFGVAASGGDTQKVAAADAHGDTENERALFLLSDDDAFYSVESWAAKDLTVAIRILAK